MHLPFCKSACYFCGCNVIYTSKEDKKDRYIQYLQKELRLLADSMNTQREVVQFHFGGGTPTFFDAEQLDTIFTMITATFPNFSSHCEISCEIDPRHFNEEQMLILQKNGFNRISFGLQDFDSYVQKYINRIQPLRLVAEGVELARKYGIQSINFDLIYGLPYQHIKGFQQTLELALSLSPDRLAIFNYAHVPWIKKTMRKIDESTLPQPNEKLKILKNTITFLTNNGYEMIGMDHFAKPNDELCKAQKNGKLRRNFQGYTTKGFSQTIGIGLSAIGEGVDYYVQNFKDMGQYEKALDNNILPTALGYFLNLDDRIRKDVIMNLMNNAKVNFTDIEKIYLREDKIHVIYEYLRTEYGIIPQNIVEKQARTIIEKYHSEGELVQNYCASILEQMGDPRSQLRLDRIEANLKMLNFMEKNEEDLYVREVSMIVYGDSKWFENNNYDEICNIIRQILGISKKESEKSDTILSLYHITPMEQEIFIKGNWKIEWGDYVLETAKLKGGIGITSNDIQTIKKITVNSPKIMTIENKTSYQRMNDNNISMMYLGGFANRHQLQFLLKVIQDNKNIEYYHFGDIDVGGFLIHRHLCRALEINFKLYAMGIEQLMDKRFINSHKELTDNDISRMNSLLIEELYIPVITYMKEHNIKLEQEIVSYYLNR